MAEGDRDELLTLAEAGRRLGRHPEALRALVRRHKLPAQRDNLGRLLLRLADLPADLSVPEQAHPAHPAELERAQPAQAAEAGLVDDLWDALAEERTARLEAVERAARAEGELAAKDGLVMELRAALDHERQE